MNKSVIISILAVLLLVVSGIIGVRIWQSSQTTESFSNQQFLSIITRDRPAFIYKNKPIVQVESVTSPENGWYIVTIKSIEAQQDSVPVRVVIMEREDIVGRLKVVLGPEVDFTDYILGTVTLPDSVIMELEK